LELHIAQRVAEELEKIQKHESSTLQSLREKISSSDSNDTSSSSKSSNAKDSNSLLNIPSISPKDLIPSSDSSEEKARKAASSQKVQQEIEKLKQQLGQRKVLHELPKNVEKARGDVISCLRLNDRKPLDCWKEVEVFKQEVRKMEEKFIGDVL